MRVRAAAKRKTEVGVRRTSAKGFQTGADSSRRGVPEARWHVCRGGAGNTVATGAPPCSCGFNGVGALRALHFVYQ